MRNDKKWNLSLFGYDIKMNNARNLLEFCLENSDEIALARKHTSFIEMKAMEQIVADEIEKIKAKSQKRIKYFQNCDSTEIKELGLKRNEIINHIKIEQLEESNTVKEYLNANFVGRDCLEETLCDYGFIRKDIRIGSFVSFPGIFDICYFDKEKVDLNELRKNFYYYPLIICGYEFEDIAFLKNGYAWGTVCSHENETILRLTEDQLIEFKKIGLSYEISE